VIGDSHVAAGSRVLVLYASANRDERKWDAPDRFDITRANTTQHLGFGSGRHICAGMHLAQLEIRSLLRAMLDRIDWFEVEEPVPALNNTLRGFSSLPMRVYR
jgi:cytochrome P450